MKSKRKDTIKQRVTSRFKGLGAIMLALFMILTDMSLMPPVEAEAATGDQYWIIGFVFYSDPLFCTGQEGNYISGNVYEVLDDTNNGMDNGYVRYYSGFKLSEGSPLTSLGTLNDSGFEIKISPEEDTYVNAGCVQRSKGSGMLFQMKVDGTVKAETTGLGEEGKAKFLLDAGKYAVKYTKESLAGNGIRSKFIVDFKSVIDSLTVTPADATLTFGGSTQTLTVSPANAADKVKWSSEDTKIATVDSDGTVTPVSAGTVTIKATYTPEDGDPIVGTCKVTVNKAESTVADPHEHDIKKMDAKEPTCTENGYKAHYECTECGKWFEDASGSVEITDKTSFIIDATGHKWDDGVVTKEATYDETGIKTFTCENDPSHTKEEVIPMKEYRESDTDNSDGSSGSSGGGSGKNSGSVSKQSIDVNGNTISSNHQAETGVPASDVGGRWANSANADIWTYTKSDGTLAKSEWMSLDYNGLRYWYYFNEDGIMLTNWFDYNGERFYLMPEKDGWRGRMATGWKNIDNKWYYFDIVPGSTQGKLYRGAITPDGHVVGADGAWNGVGETPVGQE